MYVIDRSQNWTTHPLGVVGSIFPKQVTLLNDAGLYGEAAPSDLTAPPSLEAAGADPAAGSTAEVVEGFASYRALPELTVTGVVQAPLDGTDPTLALSGRYDLTDRFGLSVGAASVAGSDAVFNAFVDFNF